MVQKSVSSGQQLATESVVSDDTIPGDSVQIQSIALNGQPELIRSLACYPLALRIQTLAAQYGQHVCDTVLQIQDA
jgi:hypothetical protein